MGLLEERKLFKNISFVAMSQFLPNIFNMAFSMVIARILLNDGVNEYSVIISYVTMFAILSDIGTSAILVRDVSRDHSRLSPYMSTYFFTRLIIVGAMVALALVCTPFMPYSPEVIHFIYIMAFSQLLFQVGQILCGIFQATERMEHIAYGMILQSVLYCVIGFVLIDKCLGNMGVAGLVYANLTSSIAILLYYAVSAYRIAGRVSLDFNVDLCKYLVIAGLPFGISGVLNTIYSYVDRFLLSILRYADVANYMNPYQLVMGLSFIMLGYATAIFPMFSKMVNRKSSLRYACEKSFKYLIVLVIPMCVGVTLLADRIVFTLWAGSFAGAVPVLQVLVWLLAFMVVTYIGSPLLTSTHREYVNMYIMLACAIANILLNVLLIPLYGAIGSSVASLLTLGVMNTVLTLYTLRDDLSGINILGPLVKVAVASGVMALFIVLVPLNNLVLYVLMGAAVYFIALLLVRCISRDDVDLAGKILLGDEGLKNPIFLFIYKLVGNQ